MRFAHLSGPFPFVAFEPLLHILRKTYSVPFFSTFFYYFIVNLRWWLFPLGAFRYFGLCFFIVLALSVPTGSVLFCFCALVLLFSCFLSLFSLCSYSFLFCLCPCLSFPKRRSCHVLPAGWEMERNGTAFGLRRSEKDYRCFFVLFYPLITLTSKC